MQTLIAIGRKVTLFGTSKWRILIPIGRKVTQNNLSIFFILCFGENLDLDIRFRLYVLFFIIEYLDPDRT